jgi:excinuclease ABC subunit C
VLEEQLPKIPQNAGVYLFYDRFDRIVYIGKAVNLRNRVRSYWNESSWGDRPKLKVMMPKVKRIETIVTKSEKEALILESNLVFKHQPRYNVLLKDNKNFPWLLITYDEPFPRLLPVRNINKFKSGDKSKNKFFGPYTNVSAMYENLNLVQELFPLRKKRVPPFKDRPCLNYDLGKCLGPCQRLVSEEDYQAMLNQVELLLHGNFRDLRDLLQEEMLRASEDLEFEKAAKLRDRIAALETFNEQQNVISENENLDQDVFALVFDDGAQIACLQVFKTRTGKLINRDTLELDFEPEDTPAEIFESAFEQYYSQIPDSELPREILLSHDFDSSDWDPCEANTLDLKQGIHEQQIAEINKPIPSQVSKTCLFGEWLSERKGTKVYISTPKRGDKYAQVELAKRNGKIIIEKIKLEQMEEASRNINVALENLRKELDLRSTPSRIECFDISHIQGSDTVASMVCFIDGLPIKNEYRKFKISRDQNDDFASMQEVIARRYAPMQSSRTQDTEVNQDNLPNLIIIDGGKGQLKAAYEIMQELGLGHIAIIGLAKREEEIFLPKESRAIILDRKSPELFLVQRIRNEAHRFAVSYHRSLRAKRSLKSALDNIPGLGPAKKKLLLDNFGTLNKVKEASLDELASLRGFSRELAEKIKKVI